MTYSITCAGCSQVFKFRSMERIGLRVRQHACISSQPSHSLDHTAGPVSQGCDMPEVNAVAEIPSFADECQEAEFWGSHAFGPGLLEQFRPLERA
jgi:hypothetical protein